MRSAGIVFNANYLLYFDVAFTELWREAVGPWLEMTEHGFDVVVAEAGLRFRSAARFDDELAIGLAIARLGTTSLTTAIAIRRGDELLIEGELRHVVVSNQMWRPVSMPGWIREGLEPYSSAGS